MATTARDTAELRGRGFTEADVKVLYARRQRILTRLATVSNGTTTTIDSVGIAQRQRADRSTAKGRALADSPGARRKPSSDSKPPPGTRQSTTMEEWEEGSPSRERDLLGHYTFRFTEALGDFWRTEQLCAQAERDYAREAFGNRQPFNEDGPAKDKRILRDYEGVPSWSVATFEDCHPRHVEKLRREALLCPETGRKVEADPRTARIVELKREGKSQRSIAMIVGVSQPRVSQILSGAA